MIYLATRPPKTPLRRAAEAQPGDDVIALIDAALPDLTQGVLAALTELEVNGPNRDAILAALPLDALIALGNDLIAGAEAALPNSVFADAPLVDPAPSAHAAVEELADRLVGSAGETLSNPVVQALPHVGPLGRLRDDLRAVDSRRAQAVASQALADSAAGASPQAALSTAHRSLARMIVQRAGQLAQDLAHGFATGVRRAVWLLDPVTTGSAWVATRDDKVCPICSALDGAVANPDGTYPSAYGSVDGPPAHSGCRCTERPVRIGGRP